LLRVLEWLADTQQNASQPSTAATFGLPITIAVTYTDQQTRHLDESQLSLRQWSEENQQWIGLPTTVDPASNQATAQTSGTGYFDLQAPLLCPADAAEPNDDPHFGSRLTPNAGSAVQSFDSAADEDWLSIDVIQNGNYIVATHDLAAGVNTKLEVYRRDGSTLIASDDYGGGGLASRLTFTISEIGTYFVRVLPAPGGAVGCAASYQISVMHDYPVWSPLVLR
jgi:hypothetical protein